MIVGVFPLMNFLDDNKIELPEPWKSLGIIYMPLAAALALAAICTGIVGLLVKDRRKGFALTSRILGSCSMLAFVGILVLMVSLMQRVTS